MTPINPYIAGNPVGGSVAFVGRTSMGRKVRAVLSSPAENALVLYGQRRIGKTSVLQDLKARLPHEGPYRPVLFDLQDKAALPLAQVVQELALRLAHELALPAPPAWGDDAPRAFRESFLPQVLAHLAEGSILVLLFDEFDVLDSPVEAQAGAAFFPYLRELLTLDARCLKFLFVIGRRPEELSSLTLSVFKGVPSEHVSLLSPDEAAELVRLSERNGTLLWTAAAVARVVELAGGHPLLTQQLCSLVWEYAYQDDPDEPPTVGPGEVDAAVPRTLGSATNALEWLWSGLQPAQRVVASALAGAGPIAISEEQLEQRLVEGGVRIFMRELRDAPRVLQDWALLEPVAEGYRFRVELLRRWIAERKPLARAQEEVDRILPRAENLYQAALGDYRANELKQASDLLRRALNLNPHHLRANELLADILIEQGRLAEARQHLEKFYEEQPGAARPRLVQVLLSLAEVVSAVEARLALFTHVLQIEHTNQKATEGHRSIWQRRGAKALQEERLEDAQYAYIEAGLVNQVQEVELLIERKRRLGATYQQALAAWERGDKATAQRGFAEVVRLEPDHGEAKRFLHWVTTGVDPNGLLAKVQEVEDLREFTNSPNSSLHRLKVWNPLDHLRLLWWLFMAPERLAAHRKVFGGKAELSTSGWLTSALIWFPFLTLTLALGLGRLPRTEQAWSTITYLWVSAGLCLMWMLTGRGLAGAEANDASDARVGVGINGTVVVAVIVALGVTGGVVRSVPNSVAVVVAFIVAVTVAVIVMGSVVLILPALAFGAGIGTLTATFIMAGGVAGGVRGGVVGSLAFIVAFTIAGVVASRGLEDAAKQGQATWLTRSLFVLLLTSYIFLIWFSFFGGWRLFSAL